MPLPQALAERLKKRGILLEDHSKTDKQENVPEHHEEVIAEDYDDINKGFDGKRRQTVAGCPNKYNIYHDCTAYCQKKWGNGKQEPSPKTMRKYQNLIKRYPLSEGWQDVYDSGVKCYYFWNTNTDEVSWLPPHHPKAKISLSAEKMKELLRNDEDEEEMDDESEDYSDKSESEDEEMSESGSDSEKSVEIKRTNERRKEERLKHEMEKRAKGRQIKKHNDLDPMDPAAYSDIPRGKWSDGLGKQEGDECADDTASGTLFQSRPYRSPGDVLRMNKRSRKDSDDD